MNSVHIVSVIVPLYNQERHIKACINSIIHQTYTNLEIIIVNDGSTDKSRQIVEEFAAKDKRIRIIDKVNEGTSFARRDGYLSATGEFITFVDNDDLLAHDAINVMLKDIIENEVDLVIGSIKRKLGLFEKTGYFGSFPVGVVINQPELFNKYYIGFYGTNCFPVSIWGRLYRKSVVDKAYQETELFSPEMPCMAGDEYFNLKLFPYLRSMCRLEKVVYYYRYGGTINHYNRFFPEVFVLSDKRIELLDQYGYVDGYEPLFIEYVNCVYYHAQQLLEYKQADKTGVIDFFKKELAERELMPRMMEFYSSKSIIDDMGLRLILNHEYEGMYNHAYQLMKKRCGSLSYKAKKGLNNFLEFKSKFF